MKIVQLYKIYLPEGGGIAVVMHMISRFFREAEQEMVVCRAKKGQLASCDTYEGASVYRCRQYGFKSAPVSPGFLRTARVRVKRADLTIAHYPYPFADMALIGKKHGKLIVLWHCDVKKSAQPLCHLFARHTLRKADLIVVSAKNNVKASRFLRPFAYKCRIIPFCVSDDCLERGARYLAERKIDQEESSEPRDPARQGSPAGGQEAERKVRILFIGRLVWYKGVDVLLTAFAKMEHKNAELVIVGDGVRKEEMEYLAKELGLKNVTFKGNVSEEEKYRQIEACDFLVVPSTDEAEAFAIVQIEAMAFGKPVINTALKSGVPEVSIDGKTGITVTPKDAAPLAQAMDALAKDQELRRQYAKAARKRVEECYSEEMVKRKWRKAVRDVCGEGSI